MSDQALLDLQNSKLFSQKLEKAATYFAGGFEFQLWTGEGTDTPELREDLYQAALSQFFGSIQAFMPDDRNTDPLALENQSKLRRDLFALAFMIDTISPFQKAQADKNNFTPVSMLSLIEDTLKNRSDLESGALPVKAYQQVVLNYSSDAVFILQLRNNFIPTLVLGSLSKNLKEGGFMGALMTLWNTDITWKAESSSLPSGQIAELAEWMHEANRTRNFLKSLVPTFTTEAVEKNLPKEERAQIKPYTHIDERIVKLFKKMELVPESGNTLTVNGLVTPAAAVSERLEDYSQLKQEIDLFIAGESQEN